MFSGAAKLPPNALTLRAPPVSTRPYTSPDIYEGGIGSASIVVFWWVLPRDSRHIIRQTQADSLAGSCIYKHRHG